MLLFLTCFTVECTKELPSPAFESSVKKRCKGLNWALKPLLLLCDVQRRPGWLSACACVCVVLARLHWVCGFAPAGARVAGAVTVGAWEAEQILASAFT